MINMNQIRDILQGRKPVTVDKHKYFAVLIPLVEIDGEVHIVYELRSNVIKKQPGEVCFPGGGIEEGETPVEAAVRETWEEIGIPPGEIEIIAECDKLINQNRFTMFCFAGKISRQTYEHIKINPDEVGEVFTVPLNWFLEHEPEIYTLDVVQRDNNNFPYEKANITPDYPWMRSKSEVPIYRYEEKAIWGLTGRITWNLVKILKGQKA